MRPISVGERMIAVTAAIVMTTGIAGGLAALAAHHGDGRINAGAVLARSGFGCGPVRIAQPEAAAGEVRSSGT